MYQSLRRRCISAGICYPNDDRKTFSKWLKPVFCLRKMIGFIPLRIDKKTFLKSIRWSKQKYGNSDIMQIRKKKKNKKTTERKNEKCMHCALLYSDNRICIIGALSCCFSFLYLFTIQIPCFLFERQQKKT